MSSKVSATELALAALRETTETALIGEFVSEAETEKNVIEVRFACTLNQYQHWHWVVTLTQADKRSQKPGLMMASIYRTLLREIEVAQFPVLQQRVRLTPLRKFWLAWKVQALGRF